MIKNLMIINALLFFAKLVFARNGAVDLDGILSQHHFLSHDFRPHQLLTSVFMHGSWGHLFGNMLGLYLFGSKLELVWGPLRFLKFYLICGVGASIISGTATYLETYSLVQEFDRAIAAGGFRDFADIYERYGLGAWSEPPIQTLYQNWASAPDNTEYARLALDSLIVVREVQVSGIALGASGAVFGIMAAAAYMFPNDYLMVNLFIPMKIKYAVPVYAIIELYLALRNNPGDQVGHVAHLGGAVIGFLWVYFSYRRKNRRLF